MIAEIVAVSYREKLPEVEISAEKLAFVSTLTGAVASVLLSMFLR